MNTVADAWIQLHMYGYNRIAHAWIQLQDDCQYNGVMIRLANMKHVNKNSICNDGYDYNDRDNRDAFDFGDHRDAREVFDFNFGYHDDSNC